MFSLAKIGTNETGGVIAVLQMPAPPILKLPIPPVRRNSPAFVVSLTLNGVLGLGQFCGGLVGF